MCLKCHNNLDAKYVLKMLIDTLENPSFDKWNTTSLNHTVISALGNESLQCRKLAIELLEKFIEYRKNKPSKPTNYSKIFKDWYYYIYEKITGKKAMRSIQDLFDNQDDGFVLEPCPSVKELTLILKKIKEYPAETLNSKSIHNAIYKEGLLYHIYGIPYNADKISDESDIDEEDNLLNMDELDTSNFFSIHPQ